MALSTCVNGDCSLVCMGSWREHWVHFSSETQASCWTVFISGYPCRVIYAFIGLVKEPDNLSQRNILLYCLSSTGHLGVDLIKQFTPRPVLSWAKIFLQNNLSKPGVFSSQCECGGYILSEQASKFMALLCTLTLPLLIAHCLQGALCPVKLVPVNVVLDKSLLRSGLQGIEHMANASFCIVCSS